jgi:hypothetical protein
VLADPEHRDVDGRARALGALARHARRQPGGRRVGGPAQVTADDADPGPDGRHDPLADAADRDRRAGAREQRADEEEDGDVLGGRLAGGAVGVHTGP